jgi:hypothetical protein
MDEALSTISSYPRSSGYLPCLEIREIRDLGLGKVQASDQRTGAAGGGHGPGEKVALHFIAVVVAQKSSCACVSTPSATTLSFKLWARLIIALAIVASP